MKTILRVILFSFAGFVIISAATVLFIFLFLRPGITQKIENMPLRVNEQLKTHHGSYSVLPKVSIYVQEAAVASQNERFYTDYGISVLGTVRAIVFTLIYNKRQGASTITEQLAKNLYFRDKDTVQTDILTKIYALFITQKYTKRQILEMYLNDIYFGRNAYGISAASQIFFQTVPNKLNLPQSAFLMGLINAPSYYSTHIYSARNEASVVLVEMKGENFVTKNQEQRAKKTVENIR